MNQRQVMHPKAMSTATLPLSPSEEMALPTRLGLVLGSGLSPFIECLTETESVSFPEAGLPASTVPGHEGRFVLGWLGRTRVIAALGRIHLYEGWSGAQVAAPIRWMAAQGVQRLILTNAAGCLNPGFAPGRWMRLTDHLNLTAQSPLTGGPHFIDLTHVYDQAWGAEFDAHAATLGLTLHTGIYAGLAGPQYETPAEIRMLQRLGADAVGMSTVLEAIQARALGLKVAAFSCLTNWGAGLSSELLDHADVLATGRMAATQLGQILRAAEGA
jgi:purine-nucleoside phosphorylase